ncbi:molybdopterin synthase subunit MoaE [Leucobacter luti]|uniref:Molybdopterin synthase subunit MoaE n=1 Tax=Leucobacter luti TaxID=340320 RepID=A0A4V3CYJ9_9MICO|nr:molybdenum cofactor biosynthesis protein MoaE [Leucobacter luti]MCW2287249.1 molybdopterin synthase catalytic subunit [Leucobacter luti]TCK41474.1 molybdopterin synthase subunit MoaE [Leucobacter luti]TDP94448.1 molybdopterin synthase subunit MoaE [Leucobacter luti]
MSAAPLARIVVEPIDEAQIRAAVDAADCGALVMFHGIVRDHDGGRGVNALDYRAHPDAERFIADCVASESERTGLRLAAVHRIGSLAIGDAALVAAAAAPHRAEAFAAIERLVERIKQEVPIWKRQHFGDGASEWVGL